MNIFDIAAIVIYFLVVLGAGFWFRKKAAESLEAYFLGGKRMHWSLLAMSGAVSNFDITGTMWMVSVLFILGMQSWWHHWMWGVALPAFALAFMAKWVRRSNVMTAAEWMKTRFGDDAGGRVARYAAAAMAVIFTAAVLGYAFQGIGKFTAVYLPLDGVAENVPAVGPWLVEHQAGVLATIVFTLTTLYVVLGGLYSVVVTDVIQTVILTAAGITIAVIAYVNVTPEVIAENVPADFTRLTPSWRMDHLAGTDNAAYQMFGFLVIAWVAKGFLMNAGGPAQSYDFQRYVAAASVRDACKLAASWPFFLVIRWGMVMGITLLALNGAVSFKDTEQIMPAILQQYLPAGVRGVVIAGLLAAFMSTFSSTVNAGASFVVRDLWQPLFRPDADERHLIRYSYLATVGLVICGVVIGAFVESIGQIWGWISMALGGGVIIPNVLRWYWWRMNGWGYAAGTIAGIVMSIYVLFAGGMADYIVLPLVCSGSLAGCMIGSLVTAPNDPALLKTFCRTVRPFGFWGPFRGDVPAEDAAAPGESTRRAVLNTVLGIIGLTAMYLCPMYLVGHWHLYAGICAACFVAAAVALYFTWYRTLPSD